MTLPSVFLKSSSLSWKIICLVACLCFFQQSRADTIQEYAVKAALTLNFARFTKWPEHSTLNHSETINLCIYGDIPIVNTFFPLNNKRVGQKKLAIQIYRLLDTDQQCHIVYVSGTNRKEIAKIFAAVGKQPTLTIGEMNGFTAAGGIINLVTIDNKVSFEVNLTAAHLSQLKISSRLLKLATIVNQPTQ